MGRPSRVFDNRRVGISIFEGTASQCARFLMDNYTEDHPDFRHVWMEPVGIDREHEDKISNDDHFVLSPEHMSHKICKKDTIEQEVLSEIKVESLNDIINKGHLYAFKKGIVLLKEKEDAIKNKSGALRMGLIETELAKVLDYYDILIKDEYSQLKIKIDERDILRNKTLGAGINND